MIQSLSNEAAKAICYDWHFWARPDQIAPWRRDPPLDIRQWIIQSGRGWGKTRSGAEELIAYAQEPDFDQSMIGARTRGDYRKINIHGPGGVLKSSPPWFQPKYEESKAQITWPNGHITLLLSSDEPEGFRGPEYGFVWADEVMTWRKAPYCWEQIMMGLRHGRARIVATFTPPRKERKGESNYLEARELLKKLHKLKHVHITRGSSYDNAPNLSPEYIEENIAPYEGTRAGRTEIHGDFLLDAEFALWTTEIIDDRRVDTPPELGIITVGVDPGAGSTDTGIVVSGKSLARYDMFLNEQTGRAGKHHFFTLADLTVSSSSTDRWAKAVIRAYYDYNADYVVVEGNHGGNMVKDVISTRDSSIPVVIENASDGKHVRADPVALLMEQGRHHLVGHYPDLEAEMTGWEPGDLPSPNRMDALVWSMYKLRKGRDGVVKVAQV